MIFSKNIFKILSGKNISLYAESESSLNIFIHNKSLKKYKISTVFNRDCVFLKEYNYSKIIQLNPTTLSIAGNGFISIANEEDI